MVKSTELDDKVALSAIEYNHQSHGRRGDGDAVSLPQNNPSNSMTSVIIARLIVGKRHCRVLIFAVS
ncbi:MAG: hypothetical protein JGK24_12585 [Microcoleus sp. PH2017_29_MFU_D_A]|jgi:hypothetical protein|uniref:hypothetical protein n=1 Tax=unclassified Microcoleus TaxID=2642155 RepID=UPI001D4B1229|nr:MULTISPECIES: hypothetical protein [unclassified Microcoleus]MCC3419194.1 hypothetical protein [Microcoleus sp. PH2017_07_MST_O_A]MCC3432813.1 hypothetical protein [Microcoleus sp. PH2017_04_SCI_O_A]MCC3445032.1 hypothetical protein [Microcoleus sp. PH2017_03_ELD_O_A]MCC3504368.1 hypothetical protein [Microcoleus sp. PH2017_19_SFW_U_A]MCC3509948.1 hypothetical protein [Microcoleus sp. PH2017_17_BER_D_A]